MNCGYNLPPTSSPNQKRLSLNLFRKKPIAVITPLVLVVIIVLITSYIILKPKTPNRTYLLSTGSSESNAVYCIHTTNLNQEISGNTATQSTQVPNTQGSASSIIKSLTEDTRGCLKFVGDIIHFSMDVGETGGVATVDIGDVHTGVQLYDDGTHGDKIAYDGVYESSYLTTSSDVIRSGLITGHFISKDGKVIQPIQAITTVTITDWSTGVGSIDPDVHYIPDPLTGDLFDPNRLTILFKEGIPEIEIFNILASGNLRLSSWLPDLYAVEVTLDTAQKYDVIRQWLLEQPDVEYVGYTYALESVGSPLPILDQYQPVNQANYLNIIRAELGWKISIGTSDIHVAIIDSGVNAKHKEFDGQIYSYYYPVLDGPIDIDNHGTFVAGIIGAEKGKTGISGISPGVNLVIFKKADLNPWSIADYIKQAVNAENRSRVINLSICSNSPGDKFFLSRAVNFAYNKNAVIIAGVGEQGKCNGPDEFFKEGSQNKHEVYPASFNKVLAVGATDIYDIHAKYSDWGNQVVYAPVPINGIISTDANGDYSVKAGTSFAVPQVSALAALIISVNPRLTNDQVIDIIIHTCDSLQPGELGLGRINVYRALMVASGKSDPGEYPLPAPITNLSAAVDQNIPQSVSLSWKIPFGDYAGVNIYRMNPADKTISQLEGGLITGSSYKDKYVSDGATYQYFVFSVDLRGQESVEYLSSEEILVKRQTGVIAFSTDKDGNHEIYVINSDGSGLTRLTYTLNFDEYFPTWSPYGNKIAYQSFQGDKSYIYVMDSDGSNQTRLTNFTVSRDPAWSPDGMKIAFDSFQEGYYVINVMNADGSNQLQLTDLKMNSVVPAWSPDGKKIAFLAEDINNYGTIYIIDADGSNLFRLTNLEFASMSPPIWSPDGKKIAYSSYEVETRGICVINADGSNLSRITNSVTSEYPAWSPDNKNIAYDAPHCIPNGRTTCEDIYIMNTDGSNQIRLTYSVSSQEPTWSPDGNKIAYYSFQDGSWGINVIYSDGSNQIRLTDGMTYSSSGFNWAP